MIYLDHAATTRPDPSVVEAMLPYLGGDFYNPSAFYRPAAKVKAGLEEARRTVADFLDVRPSAVYFTSGGTESDNWALLAGAAAGSEKGRHIIVSSLEHPAVRNTARYLEKRGFEVSYLPADSRGRADTKALYALAREDTALISVMHASNELGTIQPLEEIGAFAAERGIIFHTDAVQTFGHVPIDVKKWGIDLLSASAHKLYGPKGTGLMYISPGLRAGAMLFGGGQERGRRPGTENVAGAAGFAQAVRVASERMQEDAVRETGLRLFFENELKMAIPGLRINGGEERLPGITSATFPSIGAEALLIYLDSLGICASAGSACSTGAIEPSPVLTACGIPPEEAKRTLRFSLGRETKKEELLRTVEVLKEKLSH